MMNREGNTVAGVDSNSAEKYQVPDAQLSSYASYHVGHPSLHSTIGSSPTSWDSHMTDKDSTENGIPPNYGYNNDQYNQQREFTLSRDVHVTLNASSASSTSSSLGTTSGSHECAGYTSYPASADSYGYGTTGYQGQQSYYYGYPQQTTNPSYTQQVGANQTPGASYQTHTSSFQGTVSYVGPSSYSSTYYNAGDYQTTGGGYRSSGYSDQSNLWNDGNYGSYPISYSNYTSSDSNGTHSHGSTAVAATPVQYQQQYKQWTDYYSQSSDVSCAPGTENLSATSTSSMECSIPGNAGGYPISTDQPPPPGTTSWGPDATSLGLPSLQVTATIGGNHDSLWKHTSPGFSKNHLNYMQSYVHKPPESNPLPYESFENHQNNGLPPPPPPPLPLPPPPPNHSQGPIQYSSVNQGPPQNFQPPLQSSVPIFETHRVSKLQIPTNPRIAPSLALGIPKTDKESSTTDAAPKPAYVSVSLPKSNIKASSYDASTDAMLKPGQFPASLRAYVERSLARCKDDSQKAGCQNIMKEIITKASADGTLYTKNWDIEPLFPLPDLYSPDKDNLQGFVLPKYKRSPGRRIKSRWEPLPEEKLVKKVASVNYDPLQDVRWDRPKERERKGLQANSGKAESEDNASGIKLFSALQSNFQSKISPRPVKKPRLSDGLKGPIENGDASSDSDREQGLTQYYAAAVNLGNSPEERKKRENRFKRFDKGREVKPFTLKGVGDENSYSRRTRDLFLSKNTEEGPAVEDMDWDALTVKGTCQEIEKRYLRLTSTPDPATVRPEEVLEKALLMVQASQKNYLYKCDQLKSVRQDLTVQRIRNELTVKVYETHARLALEAGDLPEYNQCQSQLQSLYVEGIKGCHMEFSAYNLLGVILHSNNNRDLLSSMARLSAEARKDEAIKHALAVRAAVTSGNYILFFRLYKTAPKLHTCLMDLYVEKMRFEAVRCMSRSYRPTVPLAFIAQVLGFSNTASIEGNIEDTDGLEECEEWLRAHGANLITNNSGDAQLDTKATSSTLYMPEPEDAVPHGDANLAVNDFFARTS